VHSGRFRVQLTTTTPGRADTLDKGEVVRCVRREAGIAVETINQSYRGYRADQILTDDAFGLASSRDPRLEHDLTEKRRHYVELAQKSGRSPEEDTKLLSLSRELETYLPPPAETPAERAALLAQLSETTVLLTKAKSAIDLTSPDFDPDAVLAALEVTGAERDKKA